MKLAFHGAAREVTGSCHLITLDNGYNILLDCGLYQGRDEEMDDFNATWGFDPADIDVMILSHAHIDHSGRIPKLVKDGFTGCIHTTHATFSLCSIMLRDSAMIQERDAEYHNKKERRKAKKKKGKKYKMKLREPLYTMEDAARAMNQFVGHGYDRRTVINDQITVIFRDAGHILGSASVILEIQEGGKTTTIGFTGDVGRPNRPILRDPVPLPEVDWIITESTYGNKIHQEKPDEIDRFLSILKNTCLEKKGKLIIPAFSVGRTQEIVYMMDRLEHDGKLPHLPVYVDSPLAVNATQIFGGHPECFDSDLHQYMLVDDNPFGWNQLNYIKRVEDSKRLNHSKEPCVIISSSGMMNAGRVKHHLYNNIQEEKNTFLIAGYCSPETPGGKLRAGHKELKVFGEMLEVRAEIEVMDSFSAHADQQELLQHLKPHAASAKNIFLVHGEYDKQQALKSEMQDTGFERIHIPELRESVVLE